MEAIEQRGAFARRRAGTTFYCRLVDLRVARLLGAIGEIDVRRAGRWNRMDDTTRTPLATWLREILVATTRSARR